MPFSSPADQPVALLVHAGSAPVEQTLRALQLEATARVCPISRLDSAARAPVDVVVVDMAGLDEAGLSSLEAWRFSARGLLTPLILIVDEALRRQVLQRGLNENANLLKRPLEREDLRDLFDLLRTAREARGTDRQAKLRDGHYAACPKQAAALQAGNAILDQFFDRRNAHERFDHTEIGARSAQLIDCLGQTGLAEWIDAVRQHHDSTYQHCLLVTGTLLAIGHHLRMRRSDLGRLAVGGLLHDIGKADIPLDILDKPTKLTTYEMSVMHAHPLAGVERLSAMGGANAEIVALVRDHHELLDGSGYPNRLRGEQIGDFVRLLTIADVYAALVERRSYKPPMQTADVIAIMSGMHDQLDIALFRAILPVLGDVRPH